MISTAKSLQCAEGYLLTLLGCLLTFLHLKRLLGRPRGRPPSAVPAHRTKLRFPKSHQQPTFGAAAAGAAARVCAFGPPLCAVRASGPEGRDPGKRLIPTPLRLRGARCTLDRRRAYA